jgi:uncharacterized protein
MGIIIAFAVLIFIDFYAFQAVRFAVRKQSKSVIRLVNITYLAFSVLSYSIIILTQVSDYENWNTYFRTYSFALIVIFIPVKFILSFFVLFDDIVRLIRWIIKKISGFNKPKQEKIIPGKPISRSSFIVKTGLILTAIPFFSLIFGLANAYKYKIRRLKLELPDLPGSFDGFKIVQISDIHTGSFLNSEPLARAVDMINGEKPDVVFFTGDLVNNKHDEALPYTEVLGGIKGKYGVFSTFGNHDYGDYYKWKNKEDKENDILALKDIHRKMGWNLLWDEHRHIEKDGEKITVIGVQNCSGHGFHTYGSLEKATKDIEYSPVNILLSHDPSHWDQEVNKQYPHIDLTLSGHTHGMQFGVEIPGFKWSPVQYIYKEWAGLYKQKSQYLYVNRGLGFIGYPGRVGILPEITVIELVKG